MTTALIPVEISLLRKNVDSAMIFSSTNWVIVDSTTLGKTVAYVNYDRGIINVFKKSFYLRLYSTSGINPMVKICSFSLLLILYFPTSSYSSSSCSSVNKPTTASSLRLLRGCLPLMVISVVYSNFLSLRYFFHLTSSFAIIGVSSMLCFLAFVLLSMLALRNLIPFNEIPLVMVLTVAIARSRS